ncbi:MAG: hypothetical protein MJ087_03450 [Lachnospiraceae bacterium]|nr:hypothetical protein [Lachnospiraceae bacterium]
MKKRYFVLAVVLCMILMMFTGCGRDKKEEKDETAKTTEIIKMTKVYVGSRDDYGAYNMAYTGKLTPEKLIKGIEDTTGWNLALEQNVSIDKDNGYKVVFSKKSLFYTAEKLDKDDEFYVNGTENYYATVLDSIKETLRKHYAKGDDRFIIYYYGPEDSALEIKEIGKTLVMGNSYESFYVYTPGVSAVSSSNNLDVYDTEAIFIGSVDGEFYRMRVGAQINNYRVTYNALKTIMKTSSEGDILKIRIKEDKNTGEKLVTKIYWRHKK